MEQTPVAPTSRKNPPKLPITCTCGVCRKCKGRENTRRYREKTSYYWEDSTFAHDIYLLELSSKIASADMNRARAKVGATL